jgi:hypothetical protein
MLFLHTMLDFSNARLTDLAIHKVGSKLREESLQISKGLAYLSGDEVMPLLLKYFLNPFDGNEYHNFTHASDVNLNEVFTYSKNIFADEKSFYLQSIHIAKHLFEVSTHPNIKTGELYVCYFQNCRVDNETCDAIGIFKSENKDAFLKVEPAEDSYMVATENGININKLDKGCLVFKLNEEEGFKVCVVDKGNKSEEAVYWKENFLKIRPCADNYHHTKNYLNLTKEFVTERLGDEAEVSKADKIEILNKSIEYFKSREQFDEQEFAQEVFEDKQEMIRSFSEYKESYQQEKEVDFSDVFEISAPAVKKQQKVFKSVLKLDKNFHVYIHGDTSKIQKGVDENGKKYYILYYEEEN